MGEVYLARHRHWTDRRYAIKCIQPGRLKPEALARFQREIAAMGTLEHPHLVFAIDAGMHADAPYLVMEYVPGSDVQSIVNTHSPLPIPDACEIIRQACLGIQHAHDRGIIHRDIKPSNMLLSNECQVKILDLGLARMIDETSSPQLTLDGGIVGTADYLSPDQWRDSRQVTTKTDIYSLGCSLYCLLTGKPPFGWNDASSVVEKMNSHLNDTPVSARERRPEIPLELSDLIGRALAKEPAQRFGTASELAECLNSFSKEAKLSRYRVAELTEIEPENQTSPLSGPLADTNHTRDRASRLKLATRFRLGPLGCAFSLTLLLLFSILPRWMMQSKPPILDDIRSPIPGPPSGATQFDIERYWDDPDTQLRHTGGKIGEDTGVVYAGEMAKIRFHLEPDQAENFLLVSLTPQTRGNPEIFGPKDMRLTDSGAWEFPGSSTLEAKVWSFSDGIGLHAFLLIVSEGALDRDHIAGVLKQAPWTPEPTERGIWEITIDDVTRDDREMLREIYFTSPRQRSVRSIKSFDTGSAGRLARYLEQALPEHEIHGLVFPVSELKRIDALK
jgi:serine/threonine protein kinase